jgi:hypothetical protein
MIGTDWTQEEVEATAADYFDMLNKELRGEEYNKTTHRRQLSRLLNNRSDGAIERKHQNISAILIRLGFPYISGYKPLKNYQQLLFEVVSDRLQNNRQIIDLVKIQVEQPAEIPTVDDILRVLVDPPTPSHHNEPAFTGITEKSQPFRRVNYLEKEAKNHSLGDAGEKFVVRYEMARLISLKIERLAAKVEQVSATQGDSAGFDILSFEESGRERLIEVKTTTYGPLTPFFVTTNEIETSCKDNYHLYRTFDFRRNPKLFTKQGPLDKSFMLEPTQFIAMIS